MFSRLSIIFLFLCLPILITLTAQRMAETVEAPDLPKTPIMVKLAQKKGPASQRDDSAPGNTPPPQDPDAPKAPRQYTPRAIERILPDESGQPDTAAPAEAGVSP